MTEVTESIPEDDGKKLQSGKKENKPSSKLEKPDTEAQRRAPASGQQEQRDSTVGQHKSGD